MIRTLFPEIDASRRVNKSFGQIQDTEWTIVVTISSDALFLSKFEKADIGVMFVYFEVPTKGIRRLRWSSNPLILWSPKPRDPLRAACEHQQRNARGAPVHHACVTEMG